MYLVNSNEYHDFKTNNGIFVSATYVHILYVDISILHTYIHTVCTNVT